MKSSWSTRKICFCVLAVCLLLVYIFNYDVLDIFRKPIIPRDPKYKYILYWTPFFGNDTFYMGSGHDIFKDCPVKNCYMTSDKTYLPVLNFSALIFHGNELERYFMPKVRGADQLYIYANLESPAYWYHHKAFFDDYFNISMTYRLDSEIIWPYAWISDKVTGKPVAPLPNVKWKSYESAYSEEWKKNATLVRMIGKKRKIAAWFVSNCEALSGRSAYARELSKYISLDIYGDCGTLSCTKRADCFQLHVEPNYFFYLAFENSLCKDYITEKMFYPLGYYVVPVVYGGGNYTNFAPPGSYVNALDFPNPKALAKYLISLTLNLDEYMKFFWWKKYYNLDLRITVTRCAICEYVHRQKGPKHFNVPTQWLGNNKCPLQRLLDSSNNEYMTGSLAKSLNPLKN